MNIYCREHDITYRQNFLKLKAGFYDGRVR